MTFETILARDGRLVYRTRGVSMEPMLRQNRDIVVIAAVSGRLKKYDVALYRRGSRYVLHRVIRVKEGGYIIRGDNTYTPEAVPDSAVIGVLTAFKRKGKDFEVTDPAYRRYVRFWHAIYPLRFVLFQCRKLAARIARKTGLLPWIKKALGRDSGQ